MLLSLKCKEIVVTFEMWKSFNVSLCPQLWLAQLNFRAGGFALCYCTVDGTHRRFERNEKCLLQFDFCFWSQYYLKRLTAEVSERSASRVCGEKKIISETKQFKMERHCNTCSVFSTSKWCNRTENEFVCVWVCILYISLKFIVFMCMVGCIFRVIGRAHDYFYPYTSTTTLLHVRRK